MIACNTATSADVSILRKEYPDVPVVGIEPALKPAVQFMEHPRVLVMATPMTIREEKFQRLMARYERMRRFIHWHVPELWNLLSVEN